MTAPGPTLPPLKDRAAPFSRKHRRYWLVVTGGMILIGVINVALGYCMMPPAPDGPRERLEPPLPPPTMFVHRDAGADAALGPATRPE